MNNYEALPRTSGTPYQAGTVVARAALDDDRVVVDVRFGNVFSETVVPLTVEAAKTLRAQLDEAIAEAENQPSR